MIDEYQEEQKKPVEINGKIYRFGAPESTLDLEPYDEPHKNVLSQEELDMR